MKTLNELLVNSSREEILELYTIALDKSEEEDFWKEKILPYVDAILSVLLPLRDQKTAIYTGRWKSREYK